MYKACLITGRRPASLAGWPAFLPKTWVACTLYEISLIPSICEAVLDTSLKLKPFLEKKFWKASSVIERVSYLNFYTELYNHRLVGKMT